MILQYSKSYVVAAFHLFVLKMYSFKLCLFFLISYKSFYCDCGYLTGYSKRYYQLEKSR